MATMWKFLVAISLALIAATPARAIEKITIVETGSGASTRWPAYVAMEKGYFRDAGVEIEFVAAPASANVLQQVAAGSAPMGASAAVDALRAIDKGAPVSLLRVETTQAPYEVFARPAIKTLADLRGKLIMIGGAKDITRLYLERMLAPSGVKPGEYDLVYAGATAQRYAALKSGSIDATILAAPFNFRARGDGFSNLGATPDYVRDIPFSLLVVNTAWAASHRAVIAGLLKAYERGVAWFYDSANRAEAVDILRRMSKQDRGDVEQTYDFFISLHIIDRSGAIENKGLAELLRVLKDQGDLDGAPDPRRFYDPALVGGAP